MASLPILESALSQEHYSPFISQDVIRDVDHVFDVEDVVESPGGHVDAAMDADEMLALESALTTASALTASYLLNHPSFIDDDGVADVDGESRRRRLVCMIDTVLMEACEQNAFVYPNLSDWSNVHFEPALGLVANDDLKLSSSLRGARRSRFDTMQMVLLSMRDLLLQDSFATKRDLFYQHVSTLGSQSEVDAAVTIISVILGVPRIQLRILATSKGLVAGHVRFLGSDDVWQDGLVSSDGYLSVPQDVEGIGALETVGARFVLVVEKDATFQKLLDENFMQAVGPCIIVTGKGFPDVSTRQFVRLLADTSPSLPIFCLCDADPFGIEIMCCYRYGSLSMAMAPERLAVPHILWIGVHPSDMDYLDESVLLELSVTDRAKLDSLMVRPYTQCCVELREELLVMSTEGRKAEIQSFVSIVEFFKAKVMDQEWLL